MSMVSECKYTRIKKERQYINFMFIYCRSYCFWAVLIFMLTFRIDTQKFSISQRFRAGDERIELPPKVLETPIIPFDQSPLKWHISQSLDHYTYPYPICQENFPYFPIILIILIIFCRLNTPYNFLPANQPPIVPQYVPWIWRVSADSASSPCGR